MLLILDLLYGIKCGDSGSRRRHRPGGGAAAGGERLARWPAGSQHPAHGVLAAAGGLERAVEAVTGADWEAAFFDPAPSEAAGGIEWDDADGAIDVPAAPAPPGR